MNMLGNVIVIPECTNIAKNHANKCHKGIV